MIDLMRQYYLDERGMATSVFIAAAILLALAGLMLLRFSGNALSKGMGTGFLIIVALLVVVGVSAIMFNNKKLATLPDPGTTTEQALQQSELQRMDKVMSVTFRYAFIAFAVLMTVAMVLILLLKNEYWKGMAIALMVLVAPVTIGDSFNAQRNRHYQKAVAARLPG